ncbi:MAG: 3'(2'),5'-bisphosphate nucleotidase CysQ [Aquificae bacterium]|nr:3'(2'),5'-bisphosphate nucleotidase CysQ [Aquificota bacterium]
MQSLVEAVVEAVLKAGEEVLKVYERPEGVKVELKADESPLTEADRRSHEVLNSELRKILNAPVLSEEGKDVPYEVRKHWELLWLVDPLDGTKEFIKRNGEFTVNVALVKKGIPILGVVYAPAKNLLYWGGEEVGSFKRENGGERRLDLSKAEFSPPVRAVVSRSHLNEETEKFLELLPPPVEKVSVGSSLKICLVAEGKAHFYPRLGPTMEWDTAAAHAVLRYAGGKLVEYRPVESLGDLEKLPELRYNKPDLLNPHFVAFNPNALRRT